MKAPSPSSLSRLHCKPARFAVCTAAMLFAGTAWAGGFELQGDADKGKDPYQLHCAMCHGSAGKGDGPAGGALNPPPSDLTRADLDAERLFTVTRDGGAAAGLSPIMPAFGVSLGEQTIHDIVAYLLSLRE